MDMLEILWRKDFALDKASPLAAKVNGGAANGWEYIEEPEK
jgi:hypothetical protein